MTYTMKAVKPKKFLAEFCGEDLKQHVVEAFSDSYRPKYTPEQIKDIAEKSAPESYLTAAFIMDWNQIRDNKSPYFFKSGRWFPYPERRVILPAEALPGLLFTGKNGSLDFDYVHSDLRDEERSYYLGDLNVPQQARARLTSQIAPLIKEAGWSFDKSIWHLAKSLYPMHVFNTAKEEMWCVDFWFCFSAFKGLASASKSLDGKVKLY